jgi:hypothetical protein
MHLYCKTELSILEVQLLCFWTLSIVLFLFKTERFRDCFVFQIKKQDDV